LLPVAAPTTDSEAETTAAREEAPIEEELELDESGEPRALWERAAGWIIVALCTLLVFSILDSGHNWTLHLSQFQFGDLFRNTTANGGDMGAHVWWPKFLIDHWFPKFRLSGWAPDWYAGFPVGQYYFPVPALMIGALDLVMPYNVAFKLVTVSGPLMLPAGAYCFAKGMKAPWPAPPSFAVAAFATLVQTRNDWQIYGGNIASTLAGEFSFCIALAFALFGLGALAYTLDTGRRRWLPPVLLALAIMSHIVVAVFVGVAAMLLWLTRRPWRTFRIAIPVGLIAGALSAVWLLPLLWQQPYTQSMRYEKVFPHWHNKLASWVVLPGPIKHLIEGFWNNTLRPPLDTNSNPVKHFSPTLWLPWWIWVLSGIAIVAAGFYRRRSTLVLLVLAFFFGVMFIEWPENTIWNTRFLPFWMLSWAFIAAMGAAEIARFGGLVVGAAYKWIRDGDLQDARAKAWAEIATADESTVDPEVRNEAAWMLAGRTFDHGPPEWQPPVQLADRVVARTARRAAAVAIAIVMVFGSLIALHRGFEAAGNNASIAIRGWAAWNYSGYESKLDYPQYTAIMTGMEQVADEHGDGRALWEPSSGEPDAINSYGTSLALELLPLYTHGKIDSMEGIYFESSATTDYHFLTVAECAEHPSNPVRGLNYGSSTTDFDLCVRHLQDLGVRYYMAWTPEMQSKADANPNLTLVKTIAQNPSIAAPSPEKELKEWKVYEVANSDLVVGLDKEPLVVTGLKGGSYSKCWNQGTPDPSTSEAQLAAWECTTAPWWVDRTRLNTTYAQSGPSAWKRVTAAQIANDTGNLPQVAVTPTHVSNVTSSVDKISFDVSDIGKPVEVKESFFPNWKVSGAEGPYRLAPNLMVVVPTSTHVELSYGLTAADWIGRAGTVSGLVGLTLFGLWSGARRWSAGYDDNRDGSDGPDANGGHDDGVARDPDDWRDDVSDAPHDDGAPNAPPPVDTPGPSEGEPPDRSEPEPALP
jgi:hypothetical protein